MLNSSDSPVERMTITLTRDMATLIKRAVKGGGYASSSEVIREALRNWKMHLNSMQPSISTKRKPNSKSLSPQRQALERARKLVVKHVGKNRSLADELIAERRRESFE